ncbi:glycine zipper domain-containing protein [Pseudomonas sp. NPDC089569]|uniref:glycine zipper domain-containing protein n=1 Tax=Pseudomonas sp. NPDC089569 TaxID=3390722 RepID=UPI003CFF895D
MADSKYLTVDAALRSYELPAFGAVSEPFGAIGFTGAMTQLSLALDSISLDIRALTAGQGRLGEVLVSLTAALISPRSTLKAFSGVAGVGSEPAADPDARTEPRTLTELRPLPITINAPSQPCGCDLKSLMLAPAVHQVDVSITLPGSDKDAGKGGQPPQSAVPGRPSQTPSMPGPAGASAHPGELPESRSPAAPGAMEASLGRLSSAVTVDVSGLFEGLAPQVDKLSSAAEAMPTLAKGLGIVVAGVTSIVSVVGGALVDEASANVAKKILKRGARLLPFGLGDLITEKDPGGDQNNQRPPGSKRGREVPDTEVSKEVQGQQRKKAARKSQSTGRNSRKGRSQKPFRKPPEPRTPPVAQSLSLTGTVNPGPSASLFGRVAQVGSFLGRKATPLRMLGAGIEIAQGVANGDTKTLVSSSATLLGSSVGATAGAALGSLILPVVGTAIGGWLGGMAGAEIGSRLGEKLIAPTADRLAPPGQVGRELAGAQPQSPSINYSPSIQVTCTTTQSTEQIRMVVNQQLQAQFHGEFVPLMRTNALATRRDAALSDGGK